MLFGKTSNLKFTNKIALEYNEENIISDEALVSEKLKFFFQNAAKTLTF